MCLVSLYVLSNCDILEPALPEEPSQRVVWTVKRSIDAAVKVPNRLTRRAQNALYDLAVNALLTVSSFFDLLQEVLCILVSLFKDND